MSEDHEQKEIKNILVDLITDEFIVSKFVIEDSVRVFGACVFYDKPDEDAFLQTHKKAGAFQFHLEKDFRGRFLVDKENDKVFYLYFACVRDSLDQLYNVIDKEIKTELRNQVHLFEGMMGGADRIMLDCGIYRGKINVDQ